MEVLKTTMERPGSLVPLAVVWSYGFITREQCQKQRSAGGIWTYSSAGARVRLHLPALDHGPNHSRPDCGAGNDKRMGAVTRQGSQRFDSRKNSGFASHSTMMIGILVTNFGNVVAEFAEVAGSLELFGSLPKYISRANLRSHCLAHRRERTVQERREGISRRLQLLLSPTSWPESSPSQLGWTRSYPP